MSHPDALRWDARYAEEGESWLRRHPRQLLRDFAYLLPACGLALDAAAGVGNNGLFLAQHGLQVVALDVSETALRMARQQAREQSLELASAVYDLAHLWLPANRFDVIVNFYFLERGTFPIYRQALKPGGVLIFETALRASEDTPNSAYYLEPGELYQAFCDWQIVFWKECQVKTRQKKFVKAMAQLVAIKPD